MAGDLKDNLDAVLAVIKRHGQPTAKRIIEETGICKSSVQVALASLVRDHVIHSVYLRNGPIYKIGRGREVREQKRPFDVREEKIGGDPTHRVVKFGDQYKPGKGLTNKSPAMYGGNALTTIYE